MPKAPYSTRLLVSLLSTSLYQWAFPRIGRLAPTFNMSPSRYRVLTTSPFLSPPPPLLFFCANKEMYFLKKSSSDVSSVGVVYDPNFGVLLQGSSGTQSSSSSSGNLLPLLSLIALVIPVAFVLVAIVALSVMWLKCWRYRLYQNQISPAVSL